LSFSCKTLFYPRNRNSPTNFGVAAPSGSFIWSSKISIRTRLGDKPQEVVNKSCRTFSKPAQRVEAALRWLKTKLRQFIQSFLKFFGHKKEAGQVPPRNKSSGFRN